MPAPIVKPASVSLSGAIRGAAQGGGTPPRESAESAGLARGDTARHRQPPPGNGRGTSCAGSWGYAAPERLGGGRAAPQPPRRPAQRLAWPCQRPDRGGRWSSTRTSPHASPGHTCTAAGPAAITQPPDCRNGPTGSRGKPVAGRSGSSESARELRNAQPSSSRAPAWRDNARRPSQSDQPRCEKGPDTARSGAGFCCWLADRPGRYSASPQ